MKAILAKLLEAHVEFELERFRNRKYEQTIEEEVAAAFRWAQDITLKDVLTPEQVLNLIHRNVVKRPVPGGITELIGEMSRIVLNSEGNKETLLEDIFARKQFDDIVDKSVTLKNARNELIYRFLNNATFVRLISDLLFMEINGLYRDIKSYILTDNSLVKNIPFLSMIINYGREAANSIPAVPAIESAIEEKIKEYIAKNFETTVRKRELFVNDFLDENHIVEMGDGIWESIAKQPLAEYFEKINADDMEDFVVIGYDFWLHFRKTSYFTKIYTELVQYFFEKYGDKELTVILEDVGVSQEEVICEVKQVVVPGIELALKIGYLEERIRSRLMPFYNSKEAAALVKR